MLFEELVLRLVKTYFRRQISEEDKSWFRAEAGDSPAVDCLFNTLKALGFRPNTAKGSKQTDKKHNRLTCVIHFCLAKQSQELYAGNMH